MACKSAVCISSSWMVFADICLWVGPGQGHTSAILSSPPSLPAPCCHIPDALLFLPFSLQALLNSTLAALAAPHQPHPGPPGTGMWQFGPSTDARRWGFVNDCYPNEHRSRQKKVLVNKIATQNICCVFHIPCVHSGWTNTPQHVLNWAAVRS